MVVYTILTASNFFDRVIEYFGNRKIFKYFRSEADPLDGFDPSGLIILQKERSWIEQGHNVGKLVIPLARNFHNVTMDLEAGSSSKKTHPNWSMMVKEVIRHFQKRNPNNNLVQNPLGKSIRLSGHNKAKEMSNLDSSEDNRATSNSTSSDVDNSQDVAFKPSSKISST